MQSRNLIPLFLLGGLLALQVNSRECPRSHRQSHLGHDHRRKAATVDRRFQVVPAFIRRRRCEPGIVVKRICNFAITAVSVSDQNRAFVSISSCTIRINLPAPSLYRRHAVRFDL